MAEKRGRKSAAELATPSEMSEVQVKRPDPPKRLNARQKAVWKRTVDAMPIDWFGPESWDLLVLYCQQIVKAELVSAMIDKELNRLQPDTQELQRMSTVHTAAVSSSAAMATKMRITHQARTDKQSDAQRRKAQKGTPAWLKRQSA